MCVFAKPPNPVIILDHVVPMLVHYSPSFRVHTHNVHINGQMRVKPQNRLIIRVTHCNAQHYFHFFFFCIMTLYDYCTHNLRCILIIYARK